VSAAFTAGSERGTAQRPDLIGGQDAVVVAVELSQRLRGPLELFGVDPAVVVEVEGSNDRVGTHRTAGAHGPARSNRSTRTARSFGSLGRARCPRPFAVARSFGSLGRARCPGPLGIARSAGSFGPLGVARSATLGAVGPGLAPAFLAAGGFLASGAIIVVVGDRGCRGECETQTEQRGRHQGGELAQRVERSRERHGRSSEMTLLREKLFTWSSASIWNAFDPG
jgi:hypothetical protein